jgi:hypothetical protein
VERELSQVFTLGEAAVTDGQVRLGGYSALAAQTPAPPR